MDLDSITEEEYRGAKKEIARLGEVFYCPELNPIERLNLCREMGKYRKIIQAYDKKVITEDFHS
jgi:hypothetical protein